MNNHSFKLLRIALQALAKSLLCTLVLAGVTSSAQPTTLRLMVPDFLQSASESPADCLQAAGLPVVLESYPATNLVSALTNDLFSGTPPALAVVPNSSLESLDTDGWLYHITLDQAYFPVRNGTNIVGVQLPWAHEWTAIIPSTSSQLESALEVLTNSCVWQRPLQDLEESIVLGNLLSSNGFTLAWEEQWSTNYILGGIPVEITVIPTDIVGSNYYRLIIARDPRGKVFAGTESLPSTTPKTMSVKSSTKKVIQTSFCGSTTLVLSDTPGWCSQAGNCSEVVKELVCHVLDWIARQLSSNEKQAVALKGRPSVTLYFNNGENMAWGSRFRAWKIYNAMLKTDNQSWIRNVGCTRARVKNTVGGEKALTFLGMVANHGFHLNGTQSLAISPPGYNKQWQDFAMLGQVDHLTAVEGSMSSLLGANGSVIYAPGIECYGSDGQEGDSFFDQLDCIPITWDMVYDEPTEVLSITVDVQGELSWGAFGMCDVSLVGAGGGSAQAKLDGTDVHLEFKLEVYLQAECPNAAAHPCVHAKIGGGMGVYLDITYPDPCTATITATLALGWGGHGDAITIKREACDTYEMVLFTSEYKLCGDANLQAELKNNTDFTGLYGTNVTSDTIYLAFTNYVNPGVSVVYPWDPSWGYFDPGTTVVIATDCSRDDLANSTFMMMPGARTPGQTVDVTVSANWLENMGNGRFGLSYDPTVLEFQSVSSGKIGLVTIPLSWGTPYPGLLNITNDVSGGVTGAGELATVHFRALSPMRQSIVEMVNSDFRDPYGDPIDVMHGRGFVAVVHPEIAIHPELVPPNLRLTWTSFTNTDYVMQTSTNLTSWQDVTTNAGTGGQLLYETGIGGQSQQFFRLRAAAH